MSIGEFKYNIGQIVHVAKIKQNRSVVMFKGKIVSQRIVRSEKGVFVYYKVKSKTGFKKIVGPHEIYTDFNTMIEHIGSHVRIKKQDLK